MNVYAEFKVIAEDNIKRKNLANELVKKIDIKDMGLDMENAKVITDCTEKCGALYDASGNRLDNCGLIDNDYYCWQSRGHLEDEYYGTLFFATDEAGKYVEVMFEV